MSDFARKIIRKIRKILIIAFYIESGRITMIFTRKIQKNINASMITIPKPIMNVWADVERLDMLFDEAHETIVITPRR